MATLEPQREQQRMLYIPNTLANWPWRRQISPHYEEVKAASRAWVDKHAHFFKRGLEELDKADVALSASLLYATGTKDQVRLCTDYLYMSILVEYSTDFKGPAVAREVVRVILDVLENPHKERPAGEIFIGQMAKEYWESSLRIATPSAAKHFAEAWAAHLKTVITEVEDRKGERIQTVAEYFRHRRENIGVRPTYYAGELYLNLPDEAFYHPVTKDIEYVIAELGSIDNDMLSYNKEQSMDDAHCNLLTIIMRQYGCDIQEAMKKAYVFHQEGQARLRNLMSRIPSFCPEIDKELKEYIAHVVNWVPSIARWHFECRRYFGDKGEEVRRERWVAMLPKVKARL